MSPEIISISEDFLTLKVSGNLAPSELPAAQKHTEDILQREGKKRVLVIVYCFQGWSKEDLGHLSDELEVNSQIDRMAIVGDGKWEDLALLFFGKGIRGSAMEYFSGANLANAQAWLANNPVDLHGAAAEPDLREKTHASALRFAQALGET
jgi:hypothetical protein